MKSAQLLITHFPRKSDGYIGAAQDLIYLGKFKEAYELVQLGYEFDLDSTAYKYQILVLNIDGIFSFRQARSANIKLKVPFIINLNSLDEICFPSHFLLENICKNKSEFIEIEPGDIHSCLNRQLSLNVFHNCIVSPSAGIHDCDGTPYLNSILTRGVCTSIVDFPNGFHSSIDV